MVWADQELATRALVIVLENAVQLSPDGASVRVTIAHVGETVEMRVTDHGVGVAEDFRDHLFEPFTQADPSMTREHGGVGMGLYLAWRIMDAHGGSIELERTDQSGSTFVLRFLAALGDPVRQPLAR